MVYPVDMSEKLLSIFLVAAIGPFFWNTVFHEPRDYFASRGLPRRWNPSAATKKLIKDRSR